ncbi:hypothetical protein FXO38_08569 [Capsicum annuum]|nr:hypothetical protein FXO38_08569 [Capsicum annuum]
MCPPAKVVFSRRQDAIAGVKRFNNVQLDGKPMKIEIVGTNIVTPAPFPNGAFGFEDTNGVPRREEMAKIYQIASVLYDVLDSGKPRDFGIDGIMYDATTKYKGLVEAIATQLMIDTSANTLEIRFIISDRCPSMVIHNDTSVQVYLEQKTLVADFFLKYPLYVTTLDKMDGVIHQTEGAIVCVGQQCFNENNEQRRKLFAKDCVRLIWISPDFEEFEEERVDVICDVTNINIAVKQTYKDKQTLANVMELHAFMNQFLSN